MSGISDLFSSERGLFAVLLVIGATVLTALGKMTVDSWQTFVQIIFGTYVAGKTATSVVALIKGPAAVPAPVVAAGSGPVAAPVAPAAPAA